MTPLNKIQQIEELLNRLDFQHNHQGELSKNELIERLQVDCSSINNMISIIYSYLEVNIFPSLEFDQLKRKTKRLSEKLHEITEQLVSLGSNRNLELEEFYQDVNFELYKDKTNSQAIINTHQVNELKTYINKISIVKKKEVNNIEAKIWFKVGILFATGEMDDLKNRFNSNATKIAEYLNAPEYNKYILATINNYTTSNRDKNIYLNNEKMLKIVKHCKAQGISVNSSFIDRLQPD